MRTKIVFVLALFCAASVKAAVIAENGLTVIGDRGSDAIRGGPPPQRRFHLPFQLKRSERVWVEAQGLQGLRHDSNAAPEVFLDEVYLGPLRSEHGADWRSPQAVDLSPGAHVLELRCADAMDADDVSLQRLQVLSDSEARPVRTVTAKPARTDCGALVGRRDWPQRLHGKALILSVLSGRQRSSGSLVTLHEPQRWMLQARVPKGSDGRPLALAAELSYPQPGHARLLFYVDATSSPQVDELGYTPGAWEPLSFRYCGGNLAVDFARSPSLVRAGAAPALTLEIAAQDLELGLKPVSP